MNRNILYALLAAMLFGASTPFAKLLVSDVSPVLLGGLLYLGSGFGLALVRLLRDKGWQPPNLSRSEWPWLLGAIFFGGVAGPVALVFGLAHISGSHASLLLNLEAVLTALIAWLVFRENAGRRVVLGMATIIAGGVMLTYPWSGGSASAWTGIAAVALACVCWAIDNNLTRKVSASDALFIAGSKGLMAGAVNTVVALLLGAVLPGMPTVLSAMTVGFLGYGISLVFFVLALRNLGTARTGAYFSVAPFLGAAISLPLLGEAATPQFWLASALMAWGVWLHLTEHHVHKHTHEPITHSHTHTHDEHHRHLHDFEWKGDEPHVHRHEHLVVTHKHPHFPDIHHRHTH